MLVTTANKYYILLLQSEVADIDVGRNINSSQMTDMYTAICIRQSRSDSGTLKFIFFHLNR